MSWTRIDRYGRRNGNDHFLALVYVNGCSMWEGYRGTEYVGHSEDESDMVVRLFYPDNKAMKEFIDFYREDQGDKAADKLREECLELWKSRTTAHLEYDYGMDSERAKTMANEIGG